MRKMFARSLLSWGPDQWGRVIFSDESKFHLFGSDGIQYCRRFDGDAMNPLFTQKTVKHGGGKVMVWGCITQNGVGRLHRVDGIMDRHQYVQILKESLLGTLRDHHIHRRGFVFQQDNDPKHTSATATQFFQQKHIIVLPWPSNSPDLNPIEHVWNHLAQKVHSRSRLPRNENQLWEILQEEWENIDPGYIQKLYKSMISRLHAVLDRNGGNTKY
jgi:transposase